MTDTIRLGSTRGPRVFLLNQHPPSSVSRREDDPRPRPRPRPLPLPAPALVPFPSPPPPERKSPSTVFIRRSRASEVGLTIDVHPIRQESHEHLRTVLTMTRWTQGQLLNTKSEPPSSWGESRLLQTPRGPYASTSPTTRSPVLHQTTPDPRVLPQNDTDESRVPYTPWIALKGGPRYGRH